ncbi:MAG: hypothetical protein NC336_08980 [Clostridium sp.]|nr:hypothetical protein [Clostridium sp.]
MTPPLTITYPSRLPAGCDRILAQRAAIGGRLRTMLLLTLDPADPRRVTAVVPFSGETPRTIPLPLVRLEQPKPGQPDQPDQSDKSDQSEESDQPW